MTLHDVQALPDTRGIPLEQVGVRGLTYPVLVAGRGGRSQHTVASVTLAVNLPAEVKGAHLSRFVEVLAQHEGEINGPARSRLLRGLLERLGADRAAMEFDFPYFIDQPAPVTGASALMDYRVRLKAFADQESASFRLCVDVPVATVCPCSKAISDYGAHNQRGTLSLEVGCVDQDGPELPVTIEDLVDIAEASASSPLYPLLKRPDERHVTMRGYENPVFVEDLVREAARALAKDGRVGWFSVDASTDESIHNHAAFASLDGPGVTGSPSSLGW